MAVDAAGGNEPSFGPLAGLKVIDLSAFLAAPMASMFLADYGASVTKVETADQLASLVADRRPGLRFVHLKTRPGVPEGLPRPKVTPREVAGRIREVLA